MNNRGYLGGRADGADRVVQMCWPHGETPGRQPDDQQQSLFPCSIGSFSEPETKPKQRLRFSRSPPPAPASPGPAPAASEPSSSVTEGVFGPSAPDPPRYSQVGRSALGTLGSGRSGLCMTATSGSLRCVSSSRYQGCVTLFGSRTEDGLPPTQVVHLRDARTATDQVVRVRRLTVNPRQQPAWPATPPSPSALSARS